MTRNTLALSLLFVSVGCVDVDPFDGGQSGEEGLQCGALASTDLAADEASVLGFGRAEVAALAEGAHTGTLTYADGGSTGLTVEITLGDARYLDMDWIDDGTGELATPAMDMGCADVVEVDAAVDFISEDGAFAESWDTALQAPLADSASFWADLDLEALGGAYVYTPDAAYEEITAYVSGTFDPSGAHGEINGQGTQSEGSGDDGTVSATNLPIATW